MAKNLWGMALLALIHCVCFVWGWAGSVLAPTEATHDAVIAVIFGYSLLHSVLALVLTVLQVWRVRLGLVSNEQPYELVVVGQWWLYSVVVFWLSLIAVVGLPLSWGGV